MIMRQNFSPMLIPVSKIKFALPLSQESDIWIVFNHQKTKLCFVRLKFFAGLSFKKATVAPPVNIEQLRKDRYNA